ncbi:PREDICTED: cell division control protein 48 homolog C-like [Camelina sativa]|uniref:Cell division control protein 48 homolog C-like n=1 Tax=Camelina sativa TaxID=90675 RepID=A0ABM0Y6G4_CAMSA|nr:PREDICTED: cell division control protein 48 homolog C-like [Camelina sativa]
MVRRGRGGGGGGMGGGINRRYLSQVMDSCGKDLTTAEDIVDDLCSKYGNFARLTRQVLLLNVRQVLNVRNNNKRVKDDDEDDNNGDDVEGSAAQRKKQRRVDEKEEKLQRAEQSHLRKRSMERSVSSSPSSSSPSEDSGDVSTSEDAIYGEKLSPLFDLTNDSLRDNYAKLNSSSKKPIGAPEENNVEVETVSNKGRSKLATMGVRKEAKGSLSLSGTTGNGGDLVVDGNKGPTFKDFGGIKKILDDLEMNVLFPILNPEPFKKIGVKPPSGILFHGPPGCGKTKLANAIANEVGVPFYKISATDVVSGVSGASEENIRELFSDAYKTAPSIVFIDEIDAIGSKRENQQREMEKRIVTQLLTCMDGPGQKGGKSGPDSNTGFVLVIGATNRPDALDPALRRSGRFECEIALSVPDEDARAEILSVVVQKLRLEGPFDNKKIARLTPGFVGADLESIAYYAGRKAIKRIKDSRKSEQSGDAAEDDKSWLRLPWPEEELEKLFVKMSDFEEAVNIAQASLTREGFSIVPDVKWDDVGGLDHLRLEFNRYLVRPIKRPDIYKAFGVDLETGFLLYGPPGCGKTLIAKAAANEAGANFMHIKGAELLNKYVGESELAIRTLFQRARTCAPCVLFFDEVDALTTSRGKEGAWVVERLLNQFLVELDGGERRNVYVIGATNRPDVVDPAFLRPGRFGNLLYVPLPNADQRASILKAIARKKPVDPSVDLDGIAKMNCEGFSGADLAGLVQKATFQAVEEMVGSSESSEDDVLDTTQCTIKMTHFEQVLSSVSPSVNKQDRERYEALSKKLQKSIGRNTEQVTIGPSFALE